MVLDCAPSTGASEHGSLAEGLQALALKCQHTKNKICKSYEDAIEIYGRLGCPGLDQ